MSKLQLCEKCGGDLAATGVLGGSCPRCMIELGFDSQSGLEYPENTLADSLDTNDIFCPAVIGRYRILRRIGEGGMGTVYEAEQESPRRTVALKIIKPGMTNPESLRRFEQESQALGRLQHLGIAQIYEAGMADTGLGPQPYFAMEFVRGRTPRDYIRDFNVNVRERLELVAKIADAVHHAHQRGLIHRDLKPNNILVDDSGQPKILDFGIARATDNDSRTTIETNVGQLVGTLAYMSPEQVLGDPLEVDIRTDVYSMGVMLYELLAGHRPYNTRKKLHEAIQAIKEEEPPLLSSVNRTFSGDIETIAVKALEKDKTRRYTSAAELASDIRRYLKDEPIVARPASASYQLRKFARRHRALVGGIVAVFVVMVGAVMVSTSESAATKLQRILGLWRALARESIHISESHVDDDQALLLARQAFLFHNRTPDQPGYLVEDALQHANNISLLNHNLLPNQKIVVLAVRFSPRNEHLAIASSDGIVRVWNMSARGDPPEMMTIPTLRQIAAGALVVHAAFSGDGARLALSIADGVQVWNLRSPGEKPLIIQGSGRTDGLAFSSDGAWLAAGGTNVKIWSLRDPDSPPRLFPSGRVGIVSVAFSPDGFRLAASGGDGSVRMWSLRDPDPKPIMLQKSQTSRVTLGSVAFSPDGISLASGSRNMQVWNLTKPESPPLVLQGGLTDSPLDFGFAAVTFSSDSKSLSAGSSKRAWVWNLQRPQDNPLDLRIPGNVLAVAFSSESSDGTRLAVGSDESAQLWELQNAKSQPYVLHQANFSRSMAFSKDGWQLVVAAHRSLQVWNLHDPNSAARSLPARAGVMSMALSSDGLRLGTGEADGTIRVWNMRDLEAPPLYLLRPDSEQYALGKRWGIGSLAFSSDATRLTFADYSNRVGFWDLLNSGAPSRLLLTHDAERMAMSADGLRLASVEKNHDVLVWNLRKPEATPIQFKNSGGVASIAFSLDGAHLALGGAFDYKVLRIFDLIHPDHPPLMLQNSSNALASALSSDGTRLAIADEANEVHLWDLRTPLPTAVLLPGPAQINSLGGTITFSPDGSRIASTNGSGDIMVWDLWSRAADDICARVWRNLTLDEWHFYVGADFPYQRTCPSLPPGPGVLN